MNPIIPVNYNLEFKAFIQKNDFGVLCIDYPDAPDVYNHQDGTIWMQATKHHLMWPFETVMRNLPDIEYR